MSEEKTETQTPSKPSNVFHIILTTAPKTGDPTKLSEFKIDFEHTKDNVSQEDLMRIASFFSRNSITKEKMNFMIKAYKTEKGIKQRAHTAKALVKKYGMSPVAVKSVAETIRNHTNKLGPNSKERYSITPGEHLPVLNVIIQGLNRFYNDYKQHIPTGIEEQPAEEEATDVLPTGDTPAEAEEKEHERGEGLTEGQDPSPQQLQQITGAESADLAEPTHTQRIDTGERDALEDSEFYRSVIQPVLDDNFDASEIDPNTIQNDYIYNIDRLLRTLKRKLTEQQKDNLNRAKNKLRIAREALIEEQSRQPQQEEEEEEEYENTGESFEDYQSRMWKDDDRMAEFKADAAKVADPKTDKETYNYQLFLQMHNSWIKDTRRKKSQPTADETVAMADEDELEDEEEYVSSDEEEQSLPKQQRDAIDSAVSGAEPELRLPNAPSSAIPAVTQNEKGTYAQTDDKPRTDTVIPQVGQDAMGTSFERFRGNTQQETATGMLNSQGERYAGIASTASFSGGGMSQAGSGGDSATDAFSSIGGGGEVPSMFGDDDYDDGDDDPREHTNVALIDQLYGLGNNPKFFQSHLNKALMMTQNNSSVREIKMENLTRVPSNKLSKFIDCLIGLYGKNIGVKKRLTDKKAPRKDLEQEYHELKMLVEFFHINKYLNKQPTMGAVLPLEMISQMQPFLSQFNGMLGGMGGGGMPPTGMPPTVGGMMPPTGMGGGMMQQQQRQTASQALRGVNADQRRTTMTGLNQAMQRPEHQPFKINATTERVSMGVNKNTQYVGKQQDTNVLPIPVSKKPPQKRRPTIPLM